MNNKTPELPNIEDATLRACLAPLKDATQAGGGLTNPSLPLILPAHTPRPPQAGAVMDPESSGTAEFGAAPANPTPAGERAGSSSEISPNASATGSPADVPRDTAVTPPRGSPMGSPAASSRGAHWISNDNPLPAGETVGAGDREYLGTPPTLAEWRALADDEFGAFRTIELFLTMTDAELRTAAAQFPRQIAGTVARIGRIKRRLAVQYDTVATALTLLERARARAAAEHGEI